MFVSEDRPIDRTRAALLAGSSCLKLGYGRFMQTDPIGYDAGLNWYNYVDGDPINYRDPTGLTQYCADNTVSSNGTIEACDGHGGPGDIVTDGGGGGSGGGFGFGGFGGNGGSVGGSFGSGGGGSFLTPFPIVAPEVPLCPAGPRVSLGGGVSATGFLAVLGISGGFGANVTVPTASLSSYSLRGIQVSFSGSVTPLIGLGVFLGVGPNASLGGASGAVGNVSGSITPTVQAGAGDGAGVEVGSDLTSPPSVSAAMGRIAGGVYAGLGARFSGTISTDPIGCR